jgi:hypothetical protein
MGLTESRAMFTPTAKFGTTPPFAAIGRQTPDLAAGVLAIPYRR